MALRMLGTKVRPSARAKVRPQKHGDVHYQTISHRAWASAVIARDGGRCQWPGCERRAPEHRVVADHIVELKDGGAPFDLANGRCLCVQHNTAKGLRARAARAG